MKVRTMISDIPSMSNMARLSTVHITVVTAFLLSFVRVASGQVASEIEALPGYTAEIVAKASPGFRYGDVAFNPTYGLMATVAAYSRIPCDSYIAAISSDGIESKIADICVDAPLALAFSPHLNDLIFFSETAGYWDHVYTVPPGGGPSDVTLFASGFVVPLDMAFSSADGSLYVADHYYGTVFKVNQDGDVTSFVSGFTADKTGYPVFWLSITVDTRGIVYVADGFAGTVYKVTTDGNVSSFVTDLSDPSAVSFSPEGELFVADMSTNSVYSVSEYGDVSFFASGFDRPFALAFDDNGALYVLDSTFTIYKIHGDNTYIVDIDIKPGSWPNSVNLGQNGVIPVAILTTLDFDATSVDPGTVQLDGLGVAVRGKSDKLLASEEDVDEDGDLDLVVKIDVENLEPGRWQDGPVVVTGTTYDGRNVQGQDDIIVVPPEW